MYRVVGLVLCRDMESQLFDIPQGNSSTSFCSASWFSHVISWSVNILVQQFNLKKVGMGIYGTKSSCKQKHCWPFVPRWHWIDRSILSLNTIRRSVERTTNLIVHNCIHFGVCLSGRPWESSFSLTLSAHWPHTSRTHSQISLFMASSPKQLRVIIVSQQMTIQLPVAKANNLCGEEVCSSSPPICCCFSSCLVGGISKRR